VIGTFVRLAAWSMKNRAAVRLRRLRQPRYLAGLILGIGYVCWTILGHRARAPVGGASLRPDQFAPWAPHLVVLLGLALWVITMLAWIFTSGSTWRFTGAEVQFLYTAPVPRRSLVQYKLLRVQVGALFGLLVAAFFSGALFAASTVRWSFLLGGWLSLATLSLHMTGIRLAKTRLRSPVSRRTWQAWLPVATMGLVSAAVAFDLAVRLVALPPGSFTRTLEPLVRIASSGVAGIGLWPFMALVRPVVAATWTELATNMVPVGLLAIVNYAWVLRADSTAADATLAGEQRQARTGFRLRPAVRPQPFRLSPVGRPEVAILWKNLILLGRYVSVATMLRWLLPAAMLALAGAHAIGGMVITIAALIVAVYAVLLGPMLMRIDARQDLQRLSLLKTWPIRGSSLLAGELSAAALALTLVAWIALAVAFAGSKGIRIVSLSLAARASVALALAIAAPALVLGQLVIQNGAVILFPGWIPTGDARPRGLEAMGQSVIVLAGTLFAFTLGLLPAAIAGIGLGVVGFAVVGFPGVPLGALVASAVLTAESAAAVLVLGRLLERTEPSQVESNP